MGKNIRKATKQDVSRIAEILVFVKRMNFRSIFHNDAFSFGELQILSVAKEFKKQPEIYNHIWIYDDGIVKGFIHIDGQEVKQLYVDVFFQSTGIGGKLLEFAKKKYNVCYLWALKKNTGALAFYNKHGFNYKGTWKYEEGTTEHLLKLERYE